MYLFNTHDGSRFDISCLVTCTEGSCSEHWSALPVYTLQIIVGLRIILMVSLLSERYVRQSSIITSKAHAGEAKIAKARSLTCLKQSKTVHDSKTNRKRGQWICENLFNIKWGRNIHWNICFKLYIEYLRFILWFLADNCCKNLLPAGTYLPPTNEGCFHRC